MRFARHTIPAAALVAALTTSPVSADPAIGFGVSFAFGGGGPEAGIGLRVFSDDRRDETVASIGVDYMFKSKRVRPTIGAARLGDSLYIGLDVGYDFSAGAVDFGISGGAVNTKNPAAAAAPLGGGGGA